MSDQAQPSPRVLGLLSSFPRAAAACGIGIGALGAAGWLFGIERLTRIDPSFASMKLNTALSVLSTGVALALIERASRSGERSRAGQAVAAGVLALCALTILQYASGVTFGVDEALVSDPTSATHPGRPAPATATIFGLLSLALLLQRARNAWVPQLLAIAGSALGLIVLLGYLSGPKSLYRVGFFSTVALHTALSAFVLGNGVLVSREEGLLGRVRAADAGGVLARRLLPVASVAPLLLALLAHWGERAGLYERSFGGELVGVVFALVASAFVVATAGAVSRLDGEREAAERARREADERASEQRLHLARIEERRAAVERASEELRRGQARWRGAFDHSAIGMALVSPEGRWLSVNEVLGEILGRAPEELLGESFRELTYPEDLELGQVAMQEAIAGERDTYEVHKRYVHAEGNLIEAQVNVSAVRDLAGEVDYFVVQVQDMTERNQADAKLRASLAEKEVLLREIHHRVKNNLQVISSLLNLQLGNLGAEADAREVLGECQSRVQAIALVHQLLYQNDSLSQICFSRYARELTDSMVRLSHLSGVAVDYELDEVDLDLDQAVPLGLILVELVTNSLKHGLRDAGERKLTVNLAPLAEGGCRLVVADNGPGLPDLEGKGSTLGWQLIRALSSQLRAEVDYTAPGPARIALEVPPLLKEAA